MQLRISRVRRGNKIYEYAQLVESYRRASDRLPVHRVLANLGRLEPQQLQNLKMALDASRQGKEVVIPAASKSFASAVGALKPKENLRYLDVAVLLEMWRSWKLSEVLGELMPSDDCIIEDSAVVAALVIQRCVDPRSKLFAERWFPRTALPELLRVDPTSFNNSRLHRVLERLDQATPALMRRLPHIYADQQQGGFASLFLDVTDTWFVGDGPELAETSKTKEGLVLKKIGIVLLCNSRGYPLRWKVLPGKQSDSEAMLEIIGSIDGLAWLNGAPVVCDRAMGNSAHIQRMLATNVRFLTALTATEFGAYAANIPHQCLADLEPSSSCSRKDCEEAARRVEAAGMARLSDNLFLLDLGIVERPGTDDLVSPPGDVDSKIEALRLGLAIKKDVDDGQADSFRSAGRRHGLSEHLITKFVQLCKLPEDIQERVLKGTVPGVTLNDLVRLARKLPEQTRAEFEQLAQQDDITVEAMRAARAMRHAINKGEVGSQAAAGEAIGLKPSVAYKYYKLCNLPEDMQEAVINGEAVGLLLRDLIRISTLSRTEQQRAEFDALVKKAISRNRARPGKAVVAEGKRPGGVSRDPIRVHAVCYFNPDMFVGQRYRAQQRLEALQRFVDDLNAKLARPSSRRTPAKAVQEVEARLRADKYLEVFSVEIEQREIEGFARHQVRLELKPEAWARRRRYDGFSVLVAHPDLPHSAADLCRLYRAKDAVEKDFEVIKSVVKLRPVRHRTDPKVRAHVTLCMLALLLERSLKQHLNASGTSTAALEILADRCLNRYRLENGESVYAITETTDEHDAILRTLQLQHLVDDRHLADCIRPR
jgi:transposase